MAPRKSQQDPHDHFQPWWLRILEKQGFATLFAVVVLFGGWRLGEAHIEFLTQQISQMKLQTSILDEIASSNQQQEKELQYLQDAMKNSNAEHEALLEELKRARSK